VKFNNIFTELYSGEVREKILIKDLDIRYYELDENYIIIPVSLNNELVNIITENQHLEQFDKKVEYSINHFESNVATKIQAGLNRNNDLRFDIYLMIMLEEKVELSSQMRLEIENDDFCCRKMIFKGSDDFIKNEITRKLFLGNFNKAKSSIPLEIADYLNRTSMILPTEKNMSIEMLNEGIDSLLQTDEGEVINENK